MIYTFENFEFDIRRQILTREGTEIKMEPQVFDLLQLLIENHDRLVSKDEMVEVIWQNRAISDTAIASRISTARNVLGDDGRQQRLIKTVHNRGLRFLGHPKTKKSSIGVQTILASTDTPEGKPYVIVMPFKARPNNEMEMFTADALVDEISALLTAMERINIIPRYAAGFSLPVGKDPLELARGLGAQYAVTGHVRRENKKLRVRAMLTDLGSNRQLWSKKFDREMEDIFTIEDEVTSGVIGALGGKIAHVEAIRLSRQRPENLQAWELARLALAAALDWRPETLAGSVASCEKALELDPNYALAHAYLGFYLAWQAAQGWVDNLEDVRERSLAHARMAFKLTNQDGEVLSAIGDTYRCLGNLKQSAQFYDDVRARNPDVFDMWPVSLPIMGFAYAQAGQNEKAYSAIAEYEDKFPGDDMGRLWSGVSLGYIELCAKNYEKAERLLAPQNSEFNAVCRLIALINLKRVNVAIDEYKRLKKLRSSLALDHYVEYFKTYHTDPDISLEFSNALATLNGHVERSS